MYALLISVQDSDILLNNNFKYITILTDSKCCIYNCDLKYYCKFEYYYHVVQSIFKLCHILKENGKIVRLVKVPAHEGITGNELADH